VNCSDFQTNLDLYLDAELESAKMSTSALHVASCTTCNHVVTDYQKARALLITAVADRAAAVDVSGVWDEVSRSLDERKSNVTWLAAFRARRFLDASHPRIRAAAVQTGAFAATAAAAALVFSLFTGNTSQKPSSVPSSTPSQHVDVMPTPSMPITADATDVIAQSRPVRIDAMSIGAGHTVSTWFRPRTKTRVIWVASSSSPAYAVSDVSETR
jgi:hypothetical protein